jgi:hypothetical protein
MENSFKAILDLDAGKKLSIFVPAEKEKMALIIVTDSNAPEAGPHLAVLKVDRNNLSVFAFALRGALSLATTEGKM